MSSWLIFAAVVSAAFFKPPVRLDSTDLPEGMPEGMPEGYYEILEEFPNNEYAAASPETSVPIFQPDVKTDVSGPAALGLDTVKQQSGYLDVPSGGSLFYWFLESRGNPEKDPVLIWSNGGPGCSSLEAVLFENGPANIDAQNKLTRNPYSWNTFANVLYIDNPAGVGFSSSASTVADSVSASHDFIAAIKKFYESNPQFKTNKSHLSGESYAGRYVPVFAAGINADTSSPVKISSVMIGNGLVDPISEYQSYEPMSCGQGGRPQALSDNVCQQLSSTTPACSNSMQQCMSSLNRFECQYARIRCAPLDSAFRGRNPYDIRDAQCTQSGTNSCYPSSDNVQAYFNDANVQAALGAKATNGFQICNNQMNANFYGTDDPFSPTFHNVTTSLEQNVPVLAYNGDADIVLNWSGGKSWTTNSNWSGKSGFQAAAASPREWRPEGGSGPKRGEVINYNHFTFSRVADAGHMVPHDQPESAALMVESWLKGDYGFQTVKR